MPHRAVPATVRRLLLAIALALLAAAPLHAAPGEHARRQQELQELRARIEQARARLGEARDEQSGLQSRLRATEKRIGESARELRRLKTRVRDQERRLRALHGQRERLKKDLQGQRRTLADQLRAAYMLGRREHLRVLLNQEDPAALGRALTYYEYFSRARASQIQGLSEHLAELTDLERRISEETLALRGLQGDEERRRAGLERERAARKTLLSGIDQEVRQQGRRLAQMEGNARRLERLLKSLRAIMADLPPDLERHRPFAKMRGRLPWPVRGRIAHRFGTGRGLGNLKWQGVLIRAPEESPVHAIYRGRVAFADWLRGLGLLVIIDHGKGYMSLYGHNQSLLKETGDWVQTGEAVSTVGDSGGHGETGLYFEIRHAGAPVNPTRWCHRGPDAALRSALVKP